MLHFIDFLVIFLLETNGLKKYLAKIGNGIIIIDYVVDIFLLMTIKSGAWIQTLEGAGVWYRSQFSQFYWLVLCLVYTISPS